jgi:phage tail tape-measure protein
MTLTFDTIRLRDGRSYRFAGILESVRATNGDVVNVDNEGAVKDDNQTTKTVQRAAIGTAVGAIIGAIAGGGKGAAIGAIVGQAVVLVRSTYRVEMIWILFAEPS